MTYHLNINPNLIPNSQLQWMIENHQIDNPELYVQYLTMKKVEQMADRQNRSPFQLPNYF